MRCSLICLFSFLIATGCGVFQKREYHHYNSCGPTALYYATGRLGIQSSEIQISKEILNNSECYSLLRDFLSMFDGEAKEITFPSEIRNYLKDKKIKITYLAKEDFKSLSIDQTAIVLVSRKGSLTYHWACWPVTDNIDSFFGKGSTLVHQIILLERF